MVALQQLAHLGTAPRRTTIPLLNRRSFAVSSVRCLTGIHRRKLQLDGFEFVQDPFGVPDVLQFGDDFDANYGLVAPEETVLIRAYSDDGDDRMLAEIQPRYIIMLEPNLEFVRRLEVCRSLPLARFSISLDSVF